MILNILHWLNRYWQRFQRMFHRDLYYVGWIENGVLKWKEEHKIIKFPSKNFIRKQLSYTFMESVHSKGFKLLLPYSEDNIIIVSYCPSVSLITDLLIEQLKFSLVTITYIEHI